MNGNFRNILLSLLFSLFLLCGTISFASTVPFLTKSLRLGDNDFSVKSLQIFLNRDPETQVSASGVGSTGNESAYFGNLTKSAVMRFQLKYRKDVLDPLGLSSPTGFVGPATIKKIKYPWDITQGTNDVRSLLSSSMILIFVKIKERYINLSL